MSKRHYQIFGYRLPFRAPEPVGGATLTHREGLLLRLMDEDGAEGWGEVAPLPGLSRETLADCIRNTETVVRLWCSKFPDALMTMRAPSIRFGMEQAAWHVAATRAGLPMHQMISPNARASVELAALLFGDSREQLAKAVRSRLAGYGTVKVKVGVGTPEEDARFVQSISNDLGADVRIRLDSNRKWTLEQAVRFGKVIKGLPVDYIEEPVSNANALHAFYEQTGVPVALDETLLEKKPAEWTKIKGVAAVVLKPTLIGGIKASVELANAAVSMGAMPVVSSCYESGVGTLGIAALAAYITRPDEAAGLDPHWRLAEDVLEQRLDATSGTLKLSAIRQIKISPQAVKELRRG